MSGDEWHYPLICGLSAVSLYADVLPGNNIALHQWILPGFRDLLTSAKGATPMKGMWSGEKSTNAEYRPALDSIASIEPKLLASAIQAVAGTGAALIFSCTRDFGAVCLTLLDGNDRHKVYATNAQELDQALRDLVESMSPSHPPTPRGGKTR